MLLVTSWENYEIYIILINIFLHSCEQLKMEEQYG
jgi:hypothetical protein